MYRLRLESCLLLGAALLVGCGDRKTSTGLGLSTVEAIVKSHGGFLRVESEPGQGTTFEVFLPRATETAVPEANGPVGPLPGGQGELILVADDEQAIRDLLADALVEQGYRVLTAANGDQLFGTYHGQTLPDNTLVGSLAFTGGTGRFADATGNTTMRGRLTIDPSQPEPLHIVLTIEGTISSPGGLK